MKPSAISYNLAPNFCGQCRSWLGLWGTGLGSEFCHFLAACTYQTSVAWSKKYKVGNGRDQKGEVDRAAVGLDPRGRAEE